MHLVAVADPCDGNLLISSGTLPHCHRVGALSSLWMRLADTDHQSPQSTFPLQASTIFRVTPVYMLDATRAGTKDRINTGSINSHLRKLKRIAPDLVGPCRQSRYMPFRRTSSSTSYLSLTSLETLLCWFLGWLILRVIISVSKGLLRLEDAGLGR